jgi:5-methylcytosine-specific restriction endonuclease McrA
VPKQPDRKRFCSRECAFQWRNENPSSPKFSSVWPRQCGVCGRAFVARRENVHACSSGCRTESARRDNAQRAKARYRKGIGATSGERSCPECGSNFSVTEQLSIYCSKQCARRVARRARKAAKKGCSGRRRVVRFAEVFHRDGGRCHICGGVVERKLKTPDPWAGTLDHVFPLSLHGAHAPENVKLAHLKCNCMKANNIPTPELFREVAVASRAVTWRNESAHRPQG